MRQAIRIYDYGKLGRAKLIQLIHVKAGELGLPEDVRKDIQAKLTGKDSCRDMDDRELVTVCQRLVGLSIDAGLARPSRRRRRLDERQPDELPTPEQSAKIETLSVELELTHRPKVVIDLCRRVTKRAAVPQGHSWPQTRAEANKLIEALKAMVARHWRPRESEPSEVGTVEAGAHKIFRAESGDTGYESPITP